MEATRYIITDGNNYIKIKNGNQETTSNINQAKQFENYEKASNFLKTIKKSLRIFDWKVNEICLCQKDVDYIDENKIKEKVFIPTKFDDMNFDWLNKINELSKCVNELKQYKDNLLIRQSEIDREISDIEHYIENYNLNASDGFKAYKILQGRRRKRRKIKDELIKVSIIENIDIKSNNTQQIIDRIEGLDNRKYKARTDVLIELFGLEDRFVCIKE